MCVNPSRAAALLCLGCLAVEAAAGSSQPTIPDPRTLTLAPPKYASTAGEFTIASVGDLIYARPVAANPGPELQKLFDVVRAADVAIGNEEGTFFDLKTFRGYGPGSPYILLGQPELAKDLRTIGLSMVS